MYPLAQIIDCTVMGKVDIDYIYDGNADIDSVFCQRIHFNVSSCWNADVGSMFNQHLYFYVVFDV